MLEKQPMASRGWYPKERILSCRVVDFTSKQLMWRCNELMALEMFSLGFPPSVQMSPTTLDLELGNLLKDQKDLVAEYWVANG